MNQAQFYCRSIKRMCNSGGLLPSTYQQVEWIQNNKDKYYSSAPQEWFSTGVCPTHHSVHADVSGIGDGQALFGLANTVMNYSFGYWQGKFYIGTATDHVQRTGNANTRLLIDFNVNNSVYVNDVAMITSRTFYSESLLWLGCRYNAVSFTSKIYKFQIKDLSTDLLVRDFIPCYRKSDNQPGMFDICEQLFYTNTNMSFSVGANV